MRHLRLRPVQGLLTLVATLALILATVAPAGAIVRFEPTPEPVPPSWSADVPVVVEWAGVSIDLPSEWTVSVKPEPPAGALGGASILAAFGPRESLCLLHMYDPAAVETWQDVGIEATAELTIDGHRAERFDDMLGTGAAVSSAYSVHAPDYLYSLLCHADRAPADRWLSIARTLRLPAAE